MKLYSSITIVSYIEVNSEEQAEAYEKLIRDNDYESIEHLQKSIDYDAVIWTE